MAGLLVQIIFTTFIQLILNNLKNENFKFNFLPPPKFLVLALGLLTCSLLSAQGNFRYVFGNSTPSAFTGILYMTNGASIINSGAIAVPPNGQTMYIVPSGYWISVVRIIGTTNTHVEPCPTGPQQSQSWIDNGINYCLWYTSHPVNGCQEMRIVENPGGGACVP